MDGLWTAEILGLEEFQLISESRVVLEHATEEILRSCSELVDRDGALTFTHKTRDFNNRVDALAGLDSSLLDSRKRTIDI